VVFRTAHFFVWNVDARNGTKLLGLWAHSFICLFGDPRFAAGIPSWLFMLWEEFCRPIFKKSAIAHYSSGHDGACVHSLLLAFFNLVQPWHILLIAILSGTIIAFDAPARHAFVLELVDRDIWPMPLHSMPLCSTQLWLLSCDCWNSLCGLGPSFCFLINGISFLPWCGASLMQLDEQLESSSH